MRLEIVDRSRISFIDLLRSASLLFVYCSRVHRTLACHIWNVIRVYSRLRREWEEEDLYHLALTLRCCPFCRWNCSGEIDIGNSPFDGICLQGSRKVCSLHCIPPHTATPASREISYHKIEPLSMTVEIHDISTQKSSGDF